MSGKLIFDNIHGYIELPEICIKIIDTPYFQRLRKIKQIGAGYYVFPGASHNRFEHCIGTSHLAKQFMTQLKNNQPELNITDRDVLLVQIAGLIHDLGHGVMSHAFDNLFLKDVDTPHKEHEHRSGMLFEKLVEKYKIKLTQDEVKMIKDLIDPTDDNIGFIYDVVSNKKNSLDVDKMDYIMRDSRSIGLSYSFDCSRLIMQARVINNEICFPDKLSWSIYELFSTRYRLHKEIYTHPCIQQIEIMATDAIIHADEIFHIKDSIYDADLFYKITDCLLVLIEHDYSDKLEKSKEILNNIHNRNLYKFIGEINITKHTSNIIKYTEDDFIVPEVDIKKEDISVYNMSIGYTNNSENPVDNIFFYKFSDPNYKFKLEKKDVSGLLPERFNEKMVRLFCKNTEKIKEANGIFDIFKKKYLQ